MRGSAALAARTAATGLSLEHRLAAEAAVDAVLGLHDADVAAKWIGAQIRTADPAAIASALASASRLGVHQDNMARSRLMRLALRQGATPDEIARIRAAVTTSFGGFLLRFRLDRRLATGMLADLIGMPVPVIEAWERGSVPSWLHAPRVAEPLGVRDDDAWAALEGQRSCLWPLPR